MENCEIGKVVELAVGGKSTAVSIHLRQPLEHQSNRLYDIWIANQHWIAKEFLKSDEIQDAPRREFQALERVARLDLAPRPVFFDPSLAPVVIYEFMEGEMWDRQPPTGDELARLAEAWLEINALEVDWLSRGTERSLLDIENQIRAGLQEYQAWTKECFPPACKVADLSLELFEKRHQVVQKLAEVKPMYRFCRSDPRFANVIRRSGARMGFVDWEDSGLRDPARELADLICHPNQEDLLTWADWQACLRPYLGAHRRSDPDVEDRMLLYLAIFPFFALSSLVRYGIQRAAQNRLAGWRVNEMPVNQRLKRYLARALAWPDVDFTGACNQLADDCFFPGTG